MGQKGPSTIHVGAHLKNIRDYLPDQPLVIITDENIKALYSPVFPEAPVICIGTGEKVKTLATVEFILKQLMAMGCDRSVFILGIGGGIVCDITGLRHPFSCGAWISDLFPRLCCPRWMPVSVGKTG